MSGRPGTEAGGDTESRLLHSFALRCSSMSRSLEPLEIGSLPASFGSDVRAYVQSFGDVSELLARALLPRAPTPCISEIIVKGFL